MHTFELIYLWVTLVGACISPLVYAAMIGKPITKGPIIGTFRRFMFNLVANVVYVFWALEIMHKL